MKIEAGRGRGEGSVVRLCRTYNHVIVARIRYNVGLERKSQVSGSSLGALVGMCLPFSLWCCSGGRQ